jgi:hypothetical protein
MSTPVACSGCGLLVVDGLDGCKRLFDDESVREYGDPRFAGRRRLVVDAYCLQHPDRYCVSAVSLAAHLTGVCVALEHRAREAVLNTAIQRWLSSRPRLDKPVLPALHGSATIADVRAASDVLEHGLAVGRWAGDVWDAYADLHAIARDWIDRAAATVGVER